MYWFGPPRGFTRASTCPWIAHSVSGLLYLTKGRPLKPRFHCASTSIGLSSLKYSNSLDRSAKSTPSPTKGSDSLYAHSFRFYFTPLPGVLFTFPSRYLSTIDRKIYLALGGGPPGFRQGSSCPALLKNTNIKFKTLGVRDFHSLWRSFPATSARILNFLLYESVNSHFLTN